MATITQSAFHLRSSVRRAARVPSSVGADPFSLRSEGWRASAQRRKGALLPGKVT